MKRQLDRPARPRRARRVGRFKPVVLTAAAVAAFGLTVGAALAASGFVDVTDSHRASAEITAAHQVGVFQGYGDGTFRPDGKLTRGQATAVIHRMLTWQGTDDDGNFEISRADAAVLAMSGLCGLDPDRIPGCAAVGAAVSETEVQAAYDRGYNDGLDAATPTGSTPPPVTAPPALATSAQKCEDRNGFYWTTEMTLRRYRRGSISGSEWVRSGDYKLGWTARGRGDFDWYHQHVADFPNGFVCTDYRMLVSHNLENPDLHLVITELFAYCWETKIDPISGLEYELKRWYKSELHRKSGADATPALRVAVARDRPGPEHWPAYDPADCLSGAWTGS